MNLDVFTLIYWNLLRFHSLRRELCDTEMKVVTNLEQKNKPFVKKKGDRVSDVDCG